MASEIIALNTRNGSTSPSPIETERAFAEPVADDDEHRRPGGNREPHHGGVRDIVPASSTRDARGTIFRCAQISNR